MSDALAMVAPGRPLRDGLDRILRAKRGGLVVVGDGPDVLSICSGGFLLDSEFSPQRLSELAKMDGAIILAPDASRIARANVHLMPDASIPTTETGTRHRTAERVARSIDVPCCRCRRPCRSSPSTATTSSTPCSPPVGCTTGPTRPWPPCSASAAASTWPSATCPSSRSRTRCRSGDVVDVIQAAEMVLRIGEEVDGYLVELGEDGRLVGLQSAELVDGVARALDLVVRDYCG